MRDVEPAKMKRVPFTGIRRVLEKANALEGPQDSLHQMLREFDRRRLLLYNGLHATIDYRIAHWFYLRRCFFIARAISQWSKMWTGIEIHPGATIGRRLVIDHGTGIVIGETAEIGDDCLLYQGVTLGGTGKDIGKLTTNGLVVLNDIDQRHVSSHFA